MIELSPALTCFPEWQVVADQIFSQPGSPEVLRYQQGDNGPSYWLRERELRPGYLEHDDLVRANYDMGMLRHFGISMPPRDYCIVERYGIRYLRQVVAHVEAVPIGDTDPAVMAAAMEETASALERYHEWIRESGQPLALYDIARPNQYVWGCLPGDTEPQPRFCLVDVEPRMIQPDPKIDLWKIELAYLASLHRAAESQRQLAARQAN